MTDRDEQQVTPLARQAHEPEPQAVGPGESTSSRDRALKGDGSPPPALSQPTPAASAEIPVEIPGRRPSERIILAVPDEPTAEAVRHLVNGFRRSTALSQERAALERRLHALMAFEDEVAADPVNFIVERVRPEVQIALAKHLMLIPEVFDQVSRELAAWADPGVRRTREAALAEDRRVAALAAEERQRDAMAADPPPVDPPHVEPRRVKVRRVS